MSEYNDQTAQAYADSIASATFTGGVGFLEHANNKYVVKITKIDWFTSRKTGHQMRACEFEILESTSPNHKPGTKAAWVLNLTKHLEAARSNVKGQITGCHGIEGFDPAQMVQLEKDLIGKVVGLETIATVSRERRSPITKHVWSPAPAAGSAALVAQATPVATPAPVAAAPAAIPAVPPAPPAVFPPEGWTAHPTAPGWYYRGQEVVSEADLRARS